MVFVSSAFAGTPPRVQRSVPGGAAVKFQGGGPVQPSGAVVEGAEFNLGTGITECPQAGNTNPNEPLDRRQIDQVEGLSRQGDDRRSNADYSCFPQNEVSIDINPQNKNNFFVGANDYRLGLGSSGFHWTTNGGKTFYDGIIPFPSGPSSRTRGEGLIPSGGDPVAFYDRAGIAYYAQIGFFRGDDTNGVFVQRSTNGAATWSRACIPQNNNDSTSTNACGGVFDARQPGDGVVTFNSDNDTAPNGSVVFDDKEYATAGPRPAGVTPTCFTPVTRTPTTCHATVVGVDRLYVTFTRFSETASQILVSYSDDQARSWSQAKPINGSAAFCAFAVVPGACDDNQFSYPIVNVNGTLYVQFENFNTSAENQILVVRSNDGGNTFQGPFFVTPVFDVNFPRAGVTRPDCSARGAQTGRSVYTNSCFRTNAAGTINVDKRGGAFADDLYIVIADNRNGSPASSNSDVFLFKSIDGGLTWVGPTRVNDDRSQLTGNRDSTSNAGNFGNDQWWPWVDIGKNGELNVAFKDRRLDTHSVEHEWPTSRQRPGNYLVWTFGAQCKVSHADSRECLAPAAAVIPQPTAPINPGPGAQPGQGPQFVGSFKNFQVSDVPSNFDYSFRAGLFAGDYENIAVSNSNLNDDEGNDGNGSAFAVNVFTDARNGRSSRNQAGRNPICEQSDIFIDSYEAFGASDTNSTSDFSAFLVTPCPADAVEPQDDDHKGKGDDDEHKDGKG